MSDPFAGRQVPRGVLLAAAAVLTTTLLLVAMARLSGIGTTSMPDSAVVVSRDLRFVDRADGGVSIYGSDGRLVDVLPHGTNGFARGVLRGLARDRKQRGIGQQPPFSLVRYADGRLALEDPTTARRVDLDAFGPTNVAVFSRLLMKQPERTPAD